MDSTVIQRLEGENALLRLALTEIATTRTDHLRSNQMQATLHAMKNRARAALEACGPDELEKALPWL